MSLNTNTATNALPTRPPKLRANPASAAHQTTDTASKATQNLTSTTQAATDTALPGGFPGEEHSAANTKHEKDNDGPVLGPISHWWREWIPRVLDKLESKLMWLLSWILPAPRQAKLYEAAAARPASTTFIICQMVTCGVPLLVFLAGVFLFAAVAVLLWAVLSLLVLGPVLLVASMMGCSIWGWGWLFYGLVQWVDQKYFGGRLSWFWFSRVNAEEGEKEEGQGEGKQS